MCNFLFFFWARLFFWIFDASETEMNQDFQGPFGPLVFTFCGPSLWVWGPILFRPLQIETCQHKNTNLFLTESNLWMRKYCLTRSHSRTCQVKCTHAGKHALMDQSQCAVFIVVKVMFFNAQHSFSRTCSQFRITDQSILNPQKCMSREDPRIVS